MYELYLRKNGIFIILIIVIKKSAGESKVGCYPGGEIK
jgi:hypothetical protein